MKALRFSSLIIITCFTLFISSLNGQSLPTQTSTIFSGSGNCATCHQPGSPNTSALLDAHGNDVSPVTLWRSTMMGNAARDPFWRAKVSAEISANPHLQSIIEDKCTTCHSPLGRTEAIYQGSSGYTIAEMESDPLGLDGVSCTSCHQIKSDNLGTSSSFSGHYIIENDRIIYGPFTNPLTMPMQNTVNYTPQFGEQTHQSELCATCHTLFTPYVDNDGNIVGEAPEQTPYLEWKNSIYPAQDIECQTCHMPKLDEAVVISNRPSSLSARSDFARHYFVGGNVYMLRILQKFGAEIGVTASSVHFDSTIARTQRLLKNETADLTVQYEWLGMDTLLARVAIKNKSGHKFPTAYPSRRAWLHLELKDEQNAILFESGGWDPEAGDIAGLDSTYEPHYAVIKRNDEVQVYQAVMKDVDDKVNYTLLRAAGYLKDNRIPPQGFTVNGPAYDSTAIEGFAAEDASFNNNGSGSDTVYYKIGGIDKNSNYMLTVRLLYQTLSPRFVQNLLQYNTPEVQTFKSYYEQVPNLPLTIDSVALQISNTAIEEQNSAMPEDPFLVNVYPNPFNPQTTIEFRLAQTSFTELNIYDALGQKVAQLVRRNLPAGKHQYTFNAAVLPSGTYYYEVKAGQRIKRGKMTLIK